HCLRTGSARRPRPYVVGSILSVKIACLNRTPASLGSQDFQRLSAGFRQPCGDGHGSQQCHIRKEDPLVQTWLFWAFLSACFAALTAVFAKVGVQTIAPDVATLIRTVVILLLLTGIVVATGQYRLVAATPQRAWLFLILSGLATGASWLCYFRALH